MTDVAELFDRVAARTVADDPSLSRGVIFRSAGLRNADGRFVAFVSDGDLVVKLAAARVADLKASGAGRDFASGRRVMREWVRLSPADEHECRGYVEEARTFAAAGAA